MVHRRILVGLLRAAGGERDHATVASQSILEELFGVAGHDVDPQPMSPDPGQQADELTVGHEAVVAGPQPDPVGVSVTVHVDTGPALGVARVPEQRHGFVGRLALQPAQSLDDRLLGRHPVGQQQDVVGVPAKVHQVAVHRLGILA
jgi:hypothetical protein